MEPSEALGRIAYLLERDGAETYKVRAFRHAKSAIEQLAQGELIGLSPSQLRQIPSIGETSARVILEALSGKTPTYLASLEAAPMSELGDAAAGLRQLLRGDCHGHSEWSDGGSPIKEMAIAARDLGHEYWALTDHSPRLTIAHGLDADRLRQQLEIVTELNIELAPFRILTGIEVDILDGCRRDDQANGAGDNKSPHRHPRALHRPNYRRARSSAVRFRCGNRIRGMR